MKRIYLLFFLLCCGFVANAQWFPFPLGQKSFYQYNNITTSPSDTTINIYYADSMVNFGSYQIYHFDYTTPDFNGCYEEVNHNPWIYQTFYTDRVRPDSIITKNDSVLLAFSDGFQSSFTDSILFLPKIAKDSSWFSPYKSGSNIDTLKFTCDSIYIATVTGSIIDSIKLISIQAYGNSIPINSSFDNMQILLSKNYGVKQWISFYSLLKEVPLIGLDSGITQEGFQFPKFSDYFHLNVGDIIIWQEYFDSYDFVNYPSYVKYFKDSITSVLSTPDSVFYGIYRTLDNGTQFNTYRDHYKSKLKGLQLSTSIFLNHKSMLGVSYGFSDNDLIRSSSLYFTDSIFNRKYGWEGTYYDSSNCMANTIADLWNGEHYNTYYGLTSYYQGNVGGSTSWTIEGSIINGVQIGNIINVGIGEYNNKQTFKVYPNPNNQEFINIDGKEIVLIEILNLQGQKLLSSTASKILTTKMAKGIYLVNATFKNGEVITKKLIITR